MKKILPAVAFAASLTILSACHSNSNSTTVADSANNKAIATTDSLNKASLNQADSAASAQKKLSEDASKFLVKSYEESQYQIQLAKIAQTNALNAEVKRQANALYEEHMRISNQINDIAKQHHFVLPANIDNGHQKTLDDLSKRHDADFDKNYMGAVVDSHQQAANDYKDAYKNLPSGETKNFAAQTLPTIQHHLDDAKQIRQNVR
jgi:putative membrane protein